MDSTWAVSGSYLDDTWTVRGRYVDSTWTVRGQYVDGTWTVPGRYVGHIWTIPHKIYKHQIANEYEPMLIINIPKQQVHTDSELVNDSWLTIQWQIGNNYEILNGVKCTAHL